MDKQRNKAFTLVELIVVITILAILGTIAFISLQGYSKQARDSRRVSDISNIKKSLELYSLNAGYYPTPDNSSTMSYSGEVLFTQGTIGDNVAVNLSNNLQEKPIDPLFDTEYIYSITSSKKEYELVVIYEGELVGNNLVNNSYAINNYKIKVSGNYNGIFVKTSNYIVPLPSIISSEILPLDLNNTPTAIDSMVVTGGNNITAFGPNESITGQLDINLSVYTGSLTKNSSNQDKENLAKVIQNTYTGTVLSNQTIYKNILGSTSTEELVSFIDYIFFNNNYTNTLVLVDGTCGDSNGGDYTNTPTELCSNGNVSNFVDNGEGNTYNWICNGSNGGTSVNCSANHITLITTYPGCNEPDITVGAYTLSSCNVGTTIAGTTNASYGFYFQWGNNHGTLSSGGGMTTTRVNASGYGPGNYYSSQPNFIYGSTDWSTVQNDNLWGYTDYVNGGSLDKTLLQGPCSEGYHVPTYDEWLGLIAAGEGTLWNSSGSTEGAQLRDALKMPYTGYLNRSAANFFLDVATQGNYWSSSPNGSTSGHNLTIYDTTIRFNTNDTRANGDSIRCFKN